MSPVGAAVTVGWIHRHHPLGQPGLGKGFFVSTRTSDNGKQMSDVSLLDRSTTTNAVFSVRHDFAANVC